jgi:outer membrane protein OmpA-like peptidoglycan-associated protein
VKGRVTLLAVSFSLGIADIVWLNFMLAPALLEDLGAKEGSLATMMVRSPPSPTDTPMADPPEPVEHPQPAEIDEAIADTEQLDEHDVPLKPAEAVVEPAPPAPPEAAPREPEAPDPSTAPPDKPAAGTERQPTNKDSVPRVPAVQAEPDSPLPAAITIGFGLASAEPASDAALETVAELLRTRPNLQAILVGHTDLVGTDQQNKVLGLARARSIRSALIGLGVDRKRITLKSAGESEPLIPDLDDPNQGKNRRVEIKWVERNSR